MIKKYAELCGKTYTKYYTFIRDNSSALMFLCGIVLLAGGLTEISSAQNNQLATFSQADYNDGAISSAVCNLFAMIEGKFGALIMVVAGLGAIIAASMGAYSAAVGMLVVAVGAFILRSLVSLFFGTQFNCYGGSIGGGAGSGEETGG